MEDAAASFDGETREAASRAFKRPSRGSTLACLLIASGVTESREAPTGETSGRP